jgi:hypothetical protein
MMMMMMMMMMMIIIIIIIILDYSFYSKHVEDLLFKKIRKEKCFLLVFIKEISKQFNNSAQF